VISLDKNEKDVDRYGFPQIRAGFIIPGETINLFPGKEKREVWGSGMRLPEASFLFRH